ncbi:DUF4153 domain-containing protein [Betaproteobacteria bacterium]|nr:DUF4153 domain-containing protein [Betaproteobacteria bacterium]GHU42532.1 DUF4153 domain-containing protein [Betaproteobacteria bacterium]
MFPIADTSSALTTERIGRFPKSFVYLAVGLTQGILLDLLRGASIHPALFFPWLLVAILLPGVFYCSQAADLRRRFWILGLSAALLIAIGIYQGMTIGDSGKELFERGIKLSFMLALAIFVGIPAVSVSAATWQERYPRWVAAALQTLGTLAQAGFVSWLCWMVTIVSIGLFNLISADWLNQLLANLFGMNHVNVIVISVVFALTAARSRRDDSIMDVILTRFMRLCGWIYPVIAVIGILFATGWLLNIVAIWLLELKMFLEPHRAATILLGFVIFLIFFFNLHTRCGTEERGGKWLRILSALCWLAALSMLIVVFYGFGISILEHGLTPERIWELFTAFIVAIFVLGYSAHSLFALWLRQREKNGNQLISRTHLAATLLLVAGVLLAQGGILDPRRFSVQSQLHRLETAFAQDEASEETIGETLAENTGNILKFLAEEGGIYGTRALRDLAARNDDRIAEYAALALTGASRHELRNKLLDKSFEEKLHALKVFPGAEAAPSGLIEAIAEFRYRVPEICRTASQNDKPDTQPACMIWKVQFEKNGAENYILLAKDHTKDAEVWQETRPGKWENTSSFSTGCPATSIALFDAVLANSVQLVPPQNPRYDILAGNTRIIPPAPRKTGRINCDEGQ